MAIGSGDLIDKFGTQDQVTVASPSSISDGAFSLAADVNTWTNDDDAPRAIVTVMLDYTTAPTADTTIGLYCSLDDVQSTNDEPDVDTNHEDHFLGFFVPDTVTTVHYKAIEVDLLNTSTSQVYTFFLKNNTEQSITDWDIWVTPKSIGQHA